MKRTFAIAVSLTLLTALIAAGCSRSGTDAPGAQATAAASAKPSVAGLPAKFDPPIELSTVQFSLPSVKYFNGDDINNNPWSRYIEQTFGIKVKTLWAVPETEYDKKTNLMISSGDLPDFFPATPQQFKQLYDAGMLEDLTQVYANTAPNVVKKVVADAGPEVTKSAMMDGKLMAIPYTGTAKEAAPILWIRKDWMEKLKLPAPKSMDDLLRIADAFTNQDPDGNGQKDTFGLAMDKELSAIAGITNGYHAYWDIWMKDSSGKLVYSSVQPEMKNALAALQTMFKAGQVDPEFPVKPASKVNESVGAGKIGMMIGGRGSANSPLATLTPNQEWQAYPIPTVDGKPASHTLPLNIYKYYWVVKKGTKHPEALFKMLEFWLNTFYYNTSEDVFYKFVNPSKEDKSATWSMAPIRIYLSDNNIENYRQANAVLKGEKSADQLAPDRRNVYDRIMQYKNGDKKLWGEYAQNGPDGSAAIIDKVIKENRFVVNQFYGSPTQTMADKGANLDKIKSETFMKIITGNAPISEFDKFVDDWKKLGGDQITKEVNDWYAKQK
ncbi:extracellular solute-binding protein [Paenibacillus eucommiae]|uniref:Aldouronate transport system substrate-binding protein n=1 Tax=Paenibacillus eucommiae TaxID=1355755 RepID=A0ABS4IYA8_9BACL|nr:extracellular solute-binding protein [Paenibacillus eucommiae]MBP1991529.1 putative aldouronate transport system substrate-binding protein [Paenibacillus eucommiae]